MYGHINHHILEEIMKEAVTNRQPYDLRTDDGIGDWVRELKIPEEIQKAHDSSTPVTLENALSRLQFYDGILTCLAHPVTDNKQAIRAPANNYCRQGYLPDPQQFINRLKEEAQKSPRYQDERIHLWPAGS